MKRRDFLKMSGTLSVQSLVGGTSFLSAMSVRKAEAQTGSPLAALQRALDAATDGLILPGNAQFANYNTSFNKRTQLAPQVRVVAGSAQAVQTAVNWAVNNGVPFAMRSGGHSYEGYSQSPSMVIDSRGMRSITVDAKNMQATIGSGMALGKVYEALAPYGLALPAGSCFYVGVAGHSLGGGFGLLSRPLGLACDNIISLKMVDATGNLLTASATENPDLFWAMRGGGNGNFGIVTEFTFRTPEVPTVSDFGITWVRPVDQAVTLALHIQDWLADLAPAVTCTVHFTKDPGGINVHIAGQSTGTETLLKAELDRLQKSAGKPNTVYTATRKFIDSARIFTGGEAAYESIFMKAKSDYVVEPMSAEGFTTLMQGLIKSPVAITALCDSYGGQINKVAVGDTAFVHRGDTRYSIQYYTQWTDAKDTDRYLAAIRELYQDMREYVSGGSYVNYCDLDLKPEEYGNAYWGENYPRLRQLKAKYDPKGIFQHVQGILA